MESFGLFNFLKSVFSSPPAESADETQQKETPPPATPTPPPLSTDTETAAPENNPFLALMERHDRMSKNIGRNAPKK